MDGAAACASDETRPMTERRTRMIESHASDHLGCEGLVGGDRKKGFDLGPVIATDERSGRGNAGGCGRSAVETGRGCTA